MRIIWNFAILFVWIMIFVGCKPPVQKEEKVNHGIDIQILDIVDSMRVNSENVPFITIWFSSCSNDNNVIRFFEGILIPPPPLPPSTIRETLVSEGKEFVGYRKYHDIYLIFLEDDSSIQLDKFVQMDSLNFDEEPFLRFNVYDFDRQNSSKAIEKKYLINEKGSLVFYDGNCLFDID